MELCYRNNQKSLFRKYAPLVTWFARTKLGQSYLGVPKKVALMLPNGFIQGDLGGAKATFYTRPVYSPKLSLALTRIDLVSQWLKDFREAKHLLAWELELTRKKPKLAYAVMLAESTFYPDAHVESTSVDGYVENATAQSDPWATVHDALGGTTATDDGATYASNLQIRSTSTQDRWQTIVRVFYLFDTSALTADATISAAIFGVYFGGKTDGLSITPSVRVVTSTPASNTALIVEDFDQVGATAQTDADIAYGDIATTAYNNWTFNPTGRGNVSKTGISKFGLRTHYDAGDTPPTWASNNSSEFNTTFADETGTSKDPKLVITYRLPGGKPLFFSGGVAVG